MIDKSRLHEIVDYMEGHNVMIRDRSCDHTALEEVTKVRINYTLRKFKYWYYPLGYDFSKPGHPTVRKGDNRRCSMKMAGYRINMEYGKISSIDLYLVDRDGYDVHLTVWRRG